MKYYFHALGFFLHIVSFNSLDVFITADFKCMPSKPNVRTSSSRLSIDCFSFSFYIGFVLFQFNLIFFLLILCWKIIYNFFLNWTFHIIQFKISKSVLALQVERFFPLWLLFFLCFGDLLNSFYKIYLLFHLWPWKIFRHVVYTYIY